MGVRGSYPLFFINLHCFIVCLCKTIPFHHKLFHISHVPTPHTSLVCLGVFPQSRHVLIAYHVAIIVFFHFTHFIYFGSLVAFSSVVTGHYKIKQKNNFYRKFYFFCCLFCVVPFFTLKLAVS